MATVNKIQKASDTTTVTHLTDSQIIDDGTSVGVGLSCWGAPKLGRVWALFEGSK